MKKILVICFLFFIFTRSSQSQGLNNWWIAGYSSWGGLPFGHSTLNFNSGTPVIQYDSLEMDFRHTFNSISDTLGNLLFYTNGVYIADASHDTMQNGSGINPSPYTTATSDGMAIPQANLILPKPGSNNLYYFFHSTRDQFTNGTCSRYLFLSVIDINANGGLGAVISKNTILLTDSLNTGKLSACKHANGRDWWIMCHRHNTNKFYKFLLTPYGVFGPYSQNIGVVRPPLDSGESWFSPDGTRYAYFYINGGLEIFDFDRCTGDLSNPVHINIPYENGYNVGMAISPNSNLLYVSNVFSVYQFNLTSANIAASQQIVAVYDSFVSTYPGWPPIGTFFGLASLASDGKIYITTGNSTLHMHVINNPNIIGSACDVAQHSIQVPAFYFNTLPNHPNYFLGKIPGSPCDTITGVGLEENLAVKFSLAPNPNDGIFNINYTPQKDPGEMEIYDLLGNLVYKDHISQWCQFKKIDVSHIQDGIYLCRLTWGDRSARVKFIKGY